MREKLLCILTVLPFLANAQTSGKPSLKWAAPTKHSLAFKISIPEGNFLYLNKGHEYGNAFGFLGISGGAEYYFSDKYNINIDAGVLTDFMLPFPAPVDHMGDYQRSFAAYTDIQVGTDLKRFHIDAGFQYHKTSYYERETVELFPDYIDTLKYSKQQDNLGLAFSTYFRITRSFNAGFNYYPAFINLGNKPGETHYGHLLFLELIFRIRAYTPGKDRTGL